MNKARYSAWGTFIVLALAIKVFSLFPGAVEEYYSQGIYPYISDVQRLAFGWIPFSVGDVFYLIVIIFAIVKIIRFIIKLFRKQVTKKLLWTNGRKLIFILLIIYIAFNVLWGLNYNRVPLAIRLNLPVSKYGVSELSSLVVSLTDSLNALDSTYKRDERALKAKRRIFIKAARAYAFASNQIPLLIYEDRSIKPSLFSYPNNYLGISGYYNFFSGEAQVNTTMPGFVLPFVACHEIGHQLGYAKEDEANFTGFLAAHNYPDEIFRYSAYFDMYAYARRELYLRDSIAMKNLFRQLRPRVRQDFVLLRQFYEKYENPLEPIITKLYGQYLKANQQPEGMKSYNEVVSLLIAYYKSDKFKK